jgi:hypothetical protein
VITAGEEMNGERPGMAFMAAIGTRARTKKEGPAQQLQPIAEDTNTEGDREVAEVAEPEPEPVSRKENNIAVETILDLPGEIYKPRERESLAGEIWMKRLAEQTASLSVKEIQELIKTNHLWAHLQKQ